MGAEAALQAITFTTDGFSNAVSALFKGLEALRGDDSTELRATNLVMETLAYAVSHTITQVSLKRVPQRAELEAVIEAILNRAELLCSQRSIELDANNLKHPPSFSLFADAAKRIFGELSVFGTKQKNTEVGATFNDAVTTGLNRIRIKRPDYFSPVMSALIGPDADASDRVKAWAEYRASLVARFEDSPLFGEPEFGGVTLSQVYQPLRTWWTEIEEIGEAEKQDSKGVVSQREKPSRIVVEMLEDAVVDWLEQPNRADRIRLVSGGPGSGKSTFAKRLAAVLAVNPRWRVVLVPLQRLRGSGSLSGRIDTYFRDHLEEPFDGNSAPLETLGRDGHQDWVVIFDGLDELAKEGAGSESAALDFAAALADWRAQIGDSAAVRFLVLGRVPSMQEARRRLALQGRGTLHVADMLPLNESKHRYWRAQLKGSAKLIGTDQREEFWSRWAIAKGLSPEPPEAMKAEALDDLTKEPLLAYLLIMSGYVDERWSEAAENRNRIYSSIFEKIWDRERRKDTRGHLNTIGQPGFNSLMESLGLAAWGGGGRTGDEATYAKMRDAYMRQDLLADAKACGAADLANVAILFYTRRDEEGGRGYEFLHKSFGEYLTARALFNAFRRWGLQFKNPTQDFNATEFFRRWLRIAGSTPLTFEIVLFLENEVRLEASNANQESSWFAAREWAAIARDLVDAALADGLPANEDESSWRRAEETQRNAEEALWAILSSCATAGYPLNKQLNPADEGGWSAGPIVLRAFTEDAEKLPDLLTRLMRGNVFNNSIVTYGESSRFLYNVNHFRDLLYDLEPELLFPRLLSRLDLSKDGMLRVSISDANFSGANFKNALLRGRQIAETDFSGAMLDGAGLVGGSFIRCNFYGASIKGAYLQLAKLSSSTFIKASLARSNLRGANLDFAKFEETDLTRVDFRRTSLTRASLKNADLTTARLEGVVLEHAYLQDANLSKARLKDANLKGAHLQRANLESANLAGANLEGAKLRGARLKDANFEGAILKDTILDPNFTSNTLNRRRG